MSHPQVPYNPIVPLSPGGGGPDSNANSNNGTPRITAQDLDDPVHYNQTPPQAASSSDPNLNLDFGPPVPGFLGQQTTRSSTYSSLTLGVGGDRQSGYGSIAPLRDNRDSAYRDSPSGTPPPGTTALGGAAAAAAAAAGTGTGTLPIGVVYADDPSGHGREQTTYDMSEKDGLYEAPRAKTKRKGLLLAGILCGLLVVLIAVVVPVYFLVIKKSSSSSSTTTGGGGGGGPGGGGPGGHQVLTTGGDGSLVIKEDGTTFTYNNSFGGFWVYDVNNPLNQSAQAQSYTPPLSQQWKWGVDRVYGVNIGGWFTLEPFISPALYEPFNTSAVDEWTLSTLIQARDGNLNAIANHYDTFITEEDFAQIAAAGLNWVRIPLPFWAIETYPNEPFLAKTSWTYFLKAIVWARKYGLRINLDFHAAPGSQNGWNHSGKQGDINFLVGVMGVANAQRTLDYIRILAEFISQPEYRDVVPFFGILNEPQGGPIPEDAVKGFYSQAYQIVRTAGGSGQGNGPIVSLHEAYFGLTEWVGFLAGADRLALDTHTYLVFGSFPAGNPSDFVTSPCEDWAGEMGTSMSAFGITAAGEWSNAINDCGLFVNGVGEGTRYEGTLAGSGPALGSCTSWNDYSTWDASIKTGLQQLSMSTMDALGDAFFWTWKIGASSVTGKIEAPFWSYQLAIQEGWAVTDPRTSAGECVRLGSTGNAFTSSNGTFSGAQIGVGVTDALGSVPSLNASPWPPTAIGLFANAATLPTYTATGPVPTLPVSGSNTVQVTGTASVPTPTATVNLGDGWQNPADTTLMHVPIPGCAYPNQWDANNAAVPVC